MCVYCNMGDHAFRYDPPWKIEPIEPWSPYIPKPAKPEKVITPWDIARLKEYLDLLKEIKEMEDKIGCPCEPNKADYIGLFKERIQYLSENDPHDSNN